MCVAVLTRPADRGADLRVVDQVNTWFGGSSVSGCKISNVTLPGTANIPALSPLANNPGFQAVAGAVSTLLGQAVLNVITAA